jgi:S1-C subfamily serine protease
VFQIKVNFKNMEEKTINFSETSKDNKNIFKKTKFIWIAFVFFMIIISSFCGAVFGFMSGGIAQKIFPKTFKSVSQPDSEVVKQKIINEDSAVIDVVAKATPAVVSIIISKDMPKIQKFFSDPFNFPDFFDSFDNSQENNEKGDVQKKKIGGGSGFIVSENGIIVTNKHVVSDMSAEYTVITNDDKEYKAKVLAKDPLNDVAVIKIEGSGYQTLNFGDSDSLKIGQTTIAIGNSLGEFSNTVSRGIISGLKRDLIAGRSSGETEKLKNIIQTDAAINPGNSGGPLLDISGNIIGINVAMAQGAQNIGFAIPSNQVKKIVEQVEKTGKISTPYLGVRYIPIDKNIQKENNLPFDYGVLIIRGQKITDFAVIPGSPADKAGLIENDIILEIDGIKIDSENGLTDIIAKLDIGDSVKIKIWHKGDIKEISLRLEERK